MPSITISKKALLADIRSSSDSWLAEKISFMGTDLEGIHADDINVEIFPNRPDLLSQQGFTRALKSFVGQNKKLPHYPVKEGKERVIIDSSVQEVRPFTACAIVRGLSLSDKDIKDVIAMQEKLHITYGRNRKRCAIGIYPLEAITMPISYTAMAPSRIRFQALEADTTMSASQILSTHPTGKVYAHLLEGHKKYPVFMDATGEILSMPPIINSEKTGRVGLKTREVFVECSGFAYHVVHGALAMVVCALSDMGGTIESMKLTYPDAKKTSPDLSTWKLPFDIDYVHKYLGYELSASEIKKCLHKMGIGCEEKGKKLIAQIPAYRVDIIHPIDIVEDIAIGYGLENFEAQIPRVATIAQEDSLEKYCDVLREILIGHGLIEVKNFNITKEQDQGKKAVLISHSTSSEYNTLRTRMMPSALQTLNKNRQHEYPQHIFEIGDVFEVDSAEETGVREEKMLCVALCGEDADYTRIRQILDSLCSALDMNYTVKPGSEEMYMKGRIGTIHVGKKKLGVIGEVSPQKLSEYELDMPVAGFELNINGLHPPSAL